MKKIFFFTNSIQKDKHSSILHSLHVKRNISTIIFVEFSWLWFIALEKQKSGILNCWKICNEYTSEKYAHCFLHLHGMEAIRWCWGAQGITFSLSVFWVSVFHLNLNNRSSVVFWSDVLDGQSITGTSWPANILLIINFTCWHLFQMLKVILQHKTKRTVLKRAEQ